ncbi:MAG: type II toxin-antitoxin system HicB family antitoxin [Ignavibacteriales bacterium]|nr:type II toxin-antitoxin system HicB family antitoxin [Ignavibacteriales bacterium]
MKKRVANGKKKVSATKIKHNGYSLTNLMKLPYKIELIRLSKNDGGGYFAAIPLLKGCQSDGKTPDEAIEHLQQARRAWFESAIKHGDSIPIPQ